MGSTVEIPLKHNRIINDKLFFMVVKNMLDSEDNEYRQDIHYKNPLDDSMILKICLCEEEITITRHGENEVVIKLHGKEEIVKQFMKKMAIEASAIICNEFCVNAFENKDEFRKRLYKNIKEGIETTFVNSL